MRHSGVYLSVCISEVIERVRGGVCAYACMLCRGGAGQRRDLHMDLQLHFFFKILWAIFRIYYSRAFRGRFSSMSWGARSRRVAWLVTHITSPILGTFGWGNVSVSGLRQNPSITLYFEPTVTSWLCLQTVTNVSMVPE